MSVRPCVAVSVEATWEVAVMVTALYCWVGPGITAGAVYNPPLVIDPKFSPVGAPVAPLTDQFTSVLLSFKTVAVHWEVPSNCTSAGVQDIVMVGAVVVVLDPQELTIASVAVSPKKKRRLFQRTLPRPK